MTHKYINPSYKLSHSNTEMALPKIAPTTTSSLGLGSPVPSMAPSQQFQLNDQYLEDKIIEIVGKCMNKISEGRTPRIYYE